MANAESTGGELYKDSSFRWLLGGSLLSMLGDQFTLIALPWLVLKLTGDPMALGAVLAAVGIPRAIFMLVGGAAVDRFSSKHVLIISCWANAVLLMILSVLVFSGSIHIWLLYLISLALGVSHAFTFPAATAIFPQIVKPEHLQAANSIVMIARQLMVFTGPFIAGVLIAFAGTDIPQGSEAKDVIPDAAGISIVLALDAFTFVFFIWTLNFVQLKVQVEKAKEAAQNVWTSLLEGIRAVLDDKSLFAMVFFIAMISVLIGGPIQVGLPVLADKYLDDGAAAFGILIAAFGVGVLIGMAISGLRPNLKFYTLGITVVMVTLVSGLAVFSLSMVRTTTMGGIVLFITGGMVGFVQVGAFTWVQKRIPQEMMGRTMSILMFAMMGLVPVSAAVGGFIIQTASLADLFIGAGVALIALSMLAMLSPVIRAIGKNTEAPLSSQPVS